MDPSSAWILDAFILYYGLASLFSAVYSLSELGSWFEIIFFVLTLTLLFQEQHWRLIEISERSFGKILMESFDWNRCLFHFD